MLRWRYGIRALAMLGFFIVSFAATADGSDAQGVAGSIMQTAPDRIPIQIWQTGAGMDRQLSLMDKPKRIHMDSFDSDVGFRFQLAVAPIAIKAFFGWSVRIMTGSCCRAA